MPPVQPHRGEALVTHARRGIADLLVHLGRRVAVYDRVAKTPSNYVHHGNLSPSGPALVLSPSVRWISFVEQQTARNSSPQAT
jgi:hypothetical protein